VPNILNVTLPLKQDAASQAKIKGLAAKFKTDFWPKVSQVLADSKMVHYARFVVIGTPPRYVQILTEYDAPFRPYTDYFADNLKDFFGAIFDVVDDPRAGSAPPDRESVYKLVSDYDLPCLGEVYFRAYGDLTLKEIQDQFGARAKPESADCKKK
jgi:hypothetical protein